MKITRRLILGWAVCVFSAISSFPVGKIGHKPVPYQKSDEFVRLSNPKTPKNPSMRIVFKDDLTIGLKEGDENYMFGQRVYFNTDEQGNFYVTDWDRKRIQKYDPQGKFMLTIGRPGQGPGEFQNVWRPEIGSSGELYVLDIACYRMSFFDKETGRFLRQVKLPPDLHLTLVNSRGNYVGSSTLVEERPQGTKFTTIYGQFDDQLKIKAEFLRTVWEPKEGSGTGEEAVVSSLANNLSDQAFKPNPLYLLDRKDGVWFGYPQKYEVSVYAPDGKLARVISRDYDPSPVRPDDKKRFIEEQEAEFFRFLPARAASLKSKVIDAVRFPESKPAYKSFALMENGWLAVVVDTQEKDVTLFDIFDQDGRYISQFEAGLPAEGLFFKNGKAYALETTEDGYRFVKRYSFEINEK